MGLWDGRGGCLQDLWRSGDRTHILGAEQLEEGSVHLHRHHRRHLDQGADARDVRLLMLFASHGYTREI